MKMKAGHATLVAIFLLGFSPNLDGLVAGDLMTIDNGTIRVGVDRQMGAAITWLSSKNYPRNIVNIADPGRLIQQSYYAGRRLNRTAEGQHRDWSPWSWNPIQGGGVGRGGPLGTWARVVRFTKTDNTMHSQTIPKLWDMQNEEAQAVIRQWTSFEDGMPRVVQVTCEIQSMRVQSDPWGAAGLNSQEMPACYFTRNFANVKTYLGNGQWQDHHQMPGPPWGKASPPLKAMAMFDASGHGVAVFSPASGKNWNFGPHSTGLSREPTAGPCMHMAPIDRIPLGRRSTFRYRYWLVLGTETEIADSLDRLCKKYASEESQLIEPS